MTGPVTAYIGLGSNLGDRRRFIDEALGVLSDREDVELGPVSDIIETLPLGGFDMPRFLNGVAQVRTSLAPRALLNALEQIEADMGRTREARWGPRTIDLDLLLYGDQIINLADLTVPHPQMHLRTFVLKGLCQLAPELVHPRLKHTVSELARRLGGGDFAPNPRVPQLVSLCGLIGVGKTTLARKLAGALSCKLLLEPYDTNPFLPQVYAGKKELALDSQLYFLTERAAQLAPKQLAPRQMAVSDYVFAKELIYARRLLDPVQLKLYERVFAPVATGVTEPVLVVYLQDSPQHCLQRIRNRNRPYEQQIDTAFLEALGSDYDKLTSEWRQSPVIRLTTSDLDYSTNVAVQRLADQVKAYLVR